MLQFCIWWNDMLKWCCTNTSLYHNCYILYARLYSFLFINLPWFGFRSSCLIPNSVEYLNYIHRLIVKSYWLKYIYLLHFLRITSWFKRSSIVFHVMRNIFGLVTCIVDALILYEIIATNTVSASNKKSSAQKVDNEKQSMKVLNTSCIPCVDLLNGQGETSLIKFNVNNILYLLFMPIYLYILKSIIILYWIFQIIF